MPDHVHILISIPPKYSVAEVIGYLDRNKPQESDFSRFFGGHEAPRRSQVY
jgi:REP element-mobilizing transposase RayT